MHEMCIRDSYNQTDLNYTEESYINPIIQSDSGKKDTMDVMDDVQTYIELIKENISYDHHMHYDGYGKRELYDELFQVICEVVCVKRPTILSLIHIYGLGYKVLSKIL